MESKSAKTEAEFQEEAKEYVLNIQNNNKKLHKKNGCRYSKWIKEYYDFDTLDEIENSNIEHSKCLYCFPNESTSKTDNNIKMTIDFGRIFSIIGAIIGVVITIAIDKILVGAIALISLYLGFKWLGDKLCDSKLSAKSTNIVGIIMTVVMALILIFGSGFVIETFRPSKGNQTSWEDLEDWEKENAKWAYEVQQEINERENKY